MEEADEEEQGPTPATGFTLQQAKAPYNAVIAEAQALPVSAFQML